MLQRSWCCRICDTDEVDRDRVRLGSADRGSIAAELHTPSLPEAVSWARIALPDDRIAEADRMMLLILVAKVTNVGTDERKSAPFQIEGLNRVPVTAPIPAYSERVNAVIRIRIVVDPQGRVVQRIPLLKGNPSLERSVMETLIHRLAGALPSASLALSSVASIGP